MINLQVTVRTVYGNELIYPANDAATVLAKIAKAKTLSLDTLRLAREMGMTVELVNTQDSFHAISRAIRALDQP